MLCEDDSLGLCCATPHSDRIKHTVAMKVDKRMPWENRIDFLARERNEAMRPFYKSSQPFDNVVFINDVFFCAHEVLRSVLLVQTVRPPSAQAILVRELTD